MSKLMGALALAAALASPISANAAAHVVGPLSLGENFLGSYEVSGSFMDTFDFTVSPSVLNGTAAALNFSFGANSILNIAGLNFEIFSGTSATPGGAYSGGAASGDYFAKVSGVANGSAGGMYAAAINVSPVPEPATYGMLIAGLGVLTFVARRKKQKDGA